MHITFYILYYMILYDIILYYTILYYIILYYTILYYIILYYTILYYIILYLFSIWMQNAAVTTIQHSRITVHKIPWSKLRYVDTSSIIGEGKVALSAYFMPE